MEWLTIGAFAGNDIGADPSSQPACKSPILIVWVHPDVQLPMTLRNINKVIKRSRSINKFYIQAIPSHPRIMLSSVTHLAQTALCHASSLHTFIQAPISVLSNVPGTLKGTLYGYWPTAQTQFNKKRARELESEAATKSEDLMYRALENEIIKRCLDDLPVELLTTIMDDTPDDSLVALSRTNQQLRRVSSYVLLKRHKILVPDQPYTTIYIRGVVPSPAVALLSSLALPDPVTMYCDLFNLVKFTAALQCFANGNRVSSMNIEFHDSEAYLLQDRRTPYAFRTIIAALVTCRHLVVSREVLYPPTRSLPPIPHHPNNFDAEHLDMKAFVYNIATISLDTEFFAAEALRRTCGILLRSPSLYDLQLECASKDSVKKLLAMVRAPKLERFELYTVNHVDLGDAFYYRHTRLNHVSLMTHPLVPYYRSYPRQPPQLPPLRSISLTSNYCDWKMTKTSCLRHIYIHPASPDLPARNNRFLFNLGIYK
ncbi:hypothetical protein BD779DRAFT_1483305 [Infundibulicybe gibba]|nr:hypothetical protein BD779DRAFT_1483305 [Infundibulicybe gibba]